MANAKIQNFNVHNVWKLLIMSHLNFFILAFSSIFVQSKLSTPSTVWPSGFQKTRQNWPFFDELLSTQDVNVDRFARNIEWDFFCDFQTPWGFPISVSWMHCVFFVLHCRMSANCEEDRTAWVRSIQESIRKDPFYDIISAKKAALRRKSLRHIDHDIPLNSVCNSVSESTTSYSTNAEVE